ncbi:unnamed protein product [Acanthoscelides obtectus]|uniref:Uncharacterized protein n=1 Tax=Acanthoscelides obtectus TaxID=200917 RepID=A0A9P0KF94_ACAOB|nr:unnamed protein product [Acanthoscelides obtectus]CAK1681656.1 hypothetical protein AOBTE_LOCUS33194 [Acanthoscelides obtectus]
MLTIQYDPSYGSKYDYLWMPSYKYTLDYSKYDPRNPRSRFEPSRHCYWYPYYWPAHLMENTPTASSLREVRLRHNLYYLRP